jgi:AAA+ superfamily predicted ATPase
MNDDLPPLLRSLLAAVTHSPGDVPLRLHVAGVLLEEGHPADALEQCAAALRINPGDLRATDLLTRITASLGETPTSPASKPPTAGAAPTTSSRHDAVPDDSFDWGNAETQMAPSQAGDASTGARSPVKSGHQPMERPHIRLSDVGGMDQVKREIEESFLLPMVRPELRAAYGANLGGGLLLYGPPGCGKTFIARALAGELGASFVAVSLADVLDMWLGQSEKNIRSLFAQARASRPAVIFLDEVDAMGQKRSNLRNNPAMSGTVNQLLSEMDGINGPNEGVYVLAATNQPWNVDPALRRPGRFDRTLFVSPPDDQARQAILRYHLQNRPLGKIDFGRLSRQTEGFSGADLAHLCTRATRSALADAARTLEIWPIGMAELEAAGQELRPSTLEWFSTAKHAATFSNLDGAYNDLNKYLKAHKLG